MKASALIRRLCDLVEEYGDREVCLPDTLAPLRIKNPVRRAGPDSTIDGRPIFIISKDER